MERFSIRQLKARDALGNYQYEIFCDGKLFARYWHDFRGDENGINLVNGFSDESLPGRTADFIAKDNKGSLCLTHVGLSYLMSKF